MPNGPCRTWVSQAIAKIEADVTRSADTHLIRLDLPGPEGVELYLKDESTHPTGSLKHRLARSLFLYGLCSGWIREGAPVIEASSGSTAISEAYFARLLGLPFVAVMPQATSTQKIDDIRFLGGQCHFVAEPGAIYAAAQGLARDTGGHFVDQFTYAERATDWRGNNNIAESIFAQMEREEHPVPTWIVVGAGTGGTSATIGRFIRYCAPASARTRLCVVDPENSVFTDHYRGVPVAATTRASRIEGIGRPRVEPSFVPHVVDAMIGVPDAASLAGMHFVSGLLGRRVGPSTGTNFVGMLELAGRMAAWGQKGSIVGLLCDPGERYRTTAYDPTWVAEEGLDLSGWTARLSAYAERGQWEPGLSLHSRGM
jgi:cysteine synthase A